MVEKTRKNQELDAKHKVLESVFAQIDKAYGKGSVMLLGASPAAQAEVISSGSLMIDHAVGIGGFPVGRVTEIYGPEASGKTTLALQAIAQAQKSGEICAFIDAEHALDPIYAGRLGININDLIISQPDYGEQALDIAEMLIRSNAVKLIVIDSVAALVPRAELEGDMGDQHVGLQARLMSQALRKLVPVVHKSSTALVFINQVRHNIGAMAFAPKEVTTGGNALKFYASLRIDVRRIETLKDKDGVHRANRVKVKIAKNKMAPPFKVVEVELVFGEGIAREYDVIDAALSTQVLVQSGSWFSFRNEKLAQGRDALAQVIRSDAKLFAELKTQVLHAFAAGSTASHVSSQDLNQEE